MTEFHENVAVAANELSKQGQLRLKLAMATLATAIVVLGVVLTFVVIGIQNSRYEACIVQNHRHDTTVAYIRQVIKQYSRHASPAKRSQLKIVEKQDAILIQDLAPHQNCAEKVQ